MSGSPLTDTSHLAPSCGVCNSFRLHSISMKRKDGSSSIETNDADGKRQRLDPRQWSADEVQGYLSKRLGKETPTEAAAGALTLTGIELEAAIKAGTWDLSSLETAHQAAVLEAGQELMDPLMPKFMLHDSDGSGSIDVEEFRHLVQSTSVLVEASIVDCYFEAVNRNGDGRVNFAEFKDFVENSSSAKPPSLVTIPSLLRASSLKKLLALEQAVLSASPALFVTVPSEALQKVPGKASPKALDRLTLTWKSRLIAAVASVILLAVLALFLFPFFAKISDVAVPDQMDLDEVFNDTKGILGGASGSTQSSLRSCSDFLATKCTSWSKDGQWSKSDYRSCSRILHPDKPSGSIEDFRQLTDCHTLMTDTTRPLRNVQFSLLLGLYVCFVANFVIIASLSSVSGAVAFAACVVLSPEAVEGLHDQFPDLAHSFDIFVVLFAAMLAGLTVILSATRGQSSLGGWLARAKVHSVKSGHGVGAARILLVDLVHGVLDIGLVLFAVVLNNQKLDVLNVLQNFPIFDAWSLALCAALLQTLVAIPVSYHLAGRSLAELLTGTVQLCTPASGPSVKKEKEL